MALLVPLFPRAGGSIFDEDGVLVPTTGGRYDVTNPFYANLCLRGDLLRDDPLSGAGGTLVPGSPYVAVAAVSPERFGAVGDGVTDDSVPVQQALNVIRDAGGGTLTLSRMYAVRNLIAYTGTTIEGSCHSVGFRQLASSDSHAYCLSVNPGAGGSSDPAANQHDITIRNCAFVGTVAADGYSSNHHLLNLNAASNVLLEGLLIQGARGDGVYLGSSNAGGLERHNENITIRKCVFDGVNKDNRNGLSIIDGTNVLVEDCWFKNFTRSNQPGPIDIEPDPDAYARIRAITIRKNRFSNCGGNVGMVGMYIPLAQSALTTPVRGVVIDDNVFDSDNTSPTAIAVIQNQNASASTVAQEITVSRNRASGGSFRAYNIGGMRGVRFLSNDWSELGGGALFGAAGSFKNYDLLFDAGERFYRCAKSSGDCVVLYDNEKVRMANLILDSCGLANGTQGVAVSLALNATTTDIDISGLTIVAGGRTLSAVVKQVGHTMNTSLNRKKGWRNGGLGSDFVATATGEELIVQQTVNVPSIANGASYESPEYDCTGAAFYDAVRVSGSQSLKGCHLSAYVSQANKVRFTIYNSTGSAQDLDNMDYTMWVVKS